MEILHRTVTETPKPPRLTNSRIPRDLETICLKCLEKEPGARYKSANALAEDLERFGSGQTVRARPAGLTNRTWRWTRRNPALAVFGLTTSALLVALLFFVFSREAKPGGKASLAVLPFEILTSDGAARTFADGLQDDLLVTLSKISQLQVIARSSVQRYAEHPHDVDRIGRELSVAAIAEGRLTVTGDRARLAMQLVDTKTGRQIWSENYDRKIADVFALQGELALQIASALKAKLSPAESATLLRAPTTNPQAYLHCVEANELFRRYEKRRPDLEKAEQLYEQALQLDPAFALAMAEASQVQVLMQSMYDPTSARLEKACNLMEKALQLQPDLPEAHFAAGRYYGHGEFSRPGIDYEHGYREYLVALQSMPNSSDLHDAMGKLCRHLGRWAEAISHFERAAALDPNSAEGWHRLFDVQLATHNYPAAAEALDRAIAVAPNNPAFPYHRAWLQAHWKGDPSALRTWLSRFTGARDDEQITARIETGMFLREYAEPERLIALESIEPGVNEPLDRATHALQLATLYLRTGRVLEAQQVILETLPPLEELTRRQPQNAEALLRLAKIHALLGHNEEARRLATLATQLVPADRDAWFGPDVLLGLAEVYMLTGDNTKAVRLLEQLLTLAADVHRGSLRLNPRWDPLRNDPQFQKLLEK